MRAIGVDVAGLEKSVEMPRTGVLEVASGIAVIDSDPAVVVGREAGFECGIVLKGGQFVGKETV